MDFNSTIDIIIKDLKEVREIIDDLKNYPGLPVLQVELAKAKCRSAEEVLALIKTLDRNRSETVTSTEKLTPKEPDIEIKPQHPVSEDLIEFTTEESIENKSPVVTEIPEKKIIEQLRPEERKVTGTTIADKFTGAAGTISDRLGSAKTREDLASVIKRNKPLENLSDAIGISDKFLFIREIFKENQSDYEQALDKLNRAGSLQDAKAIIMSYTGENEESEVIQQLLEIVKRKIPSDG